MKESIKVRISEFVKQKRRYYEFTEMGAEDFFMNGMVEKKMGGFVECQRERCALWVNFVKGQEEYSHCGLIRGE